MTRGEIATLLSNYAGAGNDFNTRLDLVRAELLPMGNWRGTKQAILFTIFPDVDSFASVTVPRPFNGVLAGLANPPSNVVAPFCRWPIDVRNGWYETMPYSFGLAGCCSSTGFNEVNGQFCTYQDWTLPVQLQFTFETSENAGKILVQGMNNGTRVYSGSPWASGELVSFSGSGAVTTVNSFDARGLYIVKPVTRGRVTVTALNATIPSLATPGTTLPAANTVVAVYDPGETVPRWRRYHVPNITNPTTAQFLAIVKLGFVPLVSDNDECIPGNVSALRRGFEALKMEDAHDIRAEAKWKEAAEGLIREREDDEGAGASGHVIVEDTFSVGAMNAEFEWGYGSYW